MGQIALHVSDDLNKPFEGFIEFADGSPRIIRCDPDGRGIALERSGAAEAEYCRARAEAETKRAMETVHPDARKAHFEMASAYTERELAARMPEAPDAIEWFNPVRLASSWPSDLRSPRRQMMPDQPILSPDQPNDDEVKDRQRD